MEKKIELISEKIKKSKYCVALTGAGISTESGIPDFRSKNGGIYNYVSENVFSIELFYQKPEIFYNFAKKWIAEIVTKQPNLGHTGLAELEKKGILKCVITQNIDGLHQKAGSKNVLEVHGHIRTSHCLDCKKEYDFQYIYEELVKKDAILVRCKKCNGIVKPDIVFFGESLPEDFLLALNEAKKSDLMLILGTSLNVYPAASLPQYCQGELIIINKEPTPLDNFASVVLHQKISEVFKLLFQQIK